MIIEFKYSVVQDLMYHILAHMKVDNPSNLYSEAYIDNVKEIKNDSIYNEVDEQYEKIKEELNKKYDEMENFR